MIRHLHDLCALHSLIEASPHDFLNTASQAFETDMALSRRKLDVDLATSSNDALAIIQGDKLYADEYEQFVASMSYSRDDERLSFEAALASFGRIVTLFEK